MSLNRRIRAVREIVRTHYPEYDLSAREYGELTMNLVAAGVGGFFQGGIGNAVSLTRITLLGYFDRRAELMGVRGNQAIRMLNMLDDSLRCFITGYCVPRLGTNTESPHMLGGPRFGRRLSWGEGPEILSLENSMVTSTPGNRIRRTPSSGGSSGRFGSIARRLRSRGRATIKRKAFRYRVSKRVKKKVNKRRKIKRKLKKKKMKMKASKLAPKLGIQMNKDIYGSISDGTAVVMKHSSFDLDVWIRIVMMAFIRKLFMKHGVSIRSYDEPISASGQTTSTANVWRLLFSHIDSITGTLTQVNYDMTATQTLYNIASNTTGFVDFYNWLRNSFTNGEYEIPFKLTLQCIDYAGTDAYHTVASIDAGGCDIHLEVTSTLKIQNRTKGVSSTTNALDVTDMQPVHGKLYEFRSADPRLRNPESTGISTYPDQKFIGGFTQQGMENVGVTTTGSLLTLKWHEPPSSRIFSNCVKSKKVMVPVGDTQFTKLHYAFNGGFSNFIAKFREVDFGGYGQTDKYYGLPGRSQLIFLTELIQTGSTNKIDIGYERKLFASCYISSKKSPLFQPVVVEVEN